MPLTLDPRAMQAQTARPAQLAQPTPGVVDAFDAAPAPEPAPEPAQASTQASAPPPAQPSAQLSSAPPHPVADAWAAIPDPAPAPNAPPPAAPPRQTLFPEDEGYLRDRDVWVEEQMARHWGGNILRSPPLRDKAQEWVNLWHTDETATLNPLNAKFYSQKADLTPQRAYDWFKDPTENPNSGAALEKQRELLRQHYPIARYVQLRDEQANKIADAYLMSEMGTSVTGTPNERMDVRDYVLHQLEDRGWKVRNDAGLPPITLKRYEQPGSAIEPQWHSIWPQWLSEGVYAPAKGVVQGTAKVGFGLGELANSGMAVAADSMGYENAAGRARLGAQAYGPAREAMDSLLPATKMQSAHPYTLGLLESAGAMAPQVLVGWVTGPAAPLMMNAASVGGDVYHNAYELAIQQGYTPQQANELAFTTGSITAGATAAIDRFGPLQRILRTDPEGQGLLRRWAVGTVTGSGTAAGMAAVQEAAPYLAQLKPMERKQLLESLTNIKVAAFHGGALGGAMEAAHPIIAGKSGHAGEKAPAAAAPDEHGAQQGEQPAPRPDITVVDQDAAIRQVNTQAGTDTAPQEPAGLPPIPPDAGKWSFKTLRDWATKNGYTIEDAANRRELFGKLVEQERAGRSTAAAAETPANGSEHAAKAAKERPDEPVLPFGDAPGGDTPPVVSPRTDDALATGDKDTTTPVPTAPESPVSPAVEAARQFIPDLNPLEPRSSEQREAVQVAEKLGLKTQFYGSRQRGAAFVHPDHPDTLFIHTMTKGRRAIREAVGHEAYHSLKNSNPDLIDTLIGSIDPDTLSTKGKEYYQRYTDTFGQKAGEKLAGDGAGARLHDEAGATLLGEIAMKDRVWRAMQGKDPTALQAFGDSVAGIFERLKGTGKQTDAAIDAFSQRRHEVAQQVAGLAGKEVEAVGGRETRIDTQTGEVPARYVAIERAALKPSHNPRSFRKNPQHAGGQERQYHTDKTEQLKVMDYDRHFDSRHVLSDDPTPASGPPMIASDGSAIGGNNRAMLLHRVYDDPKRAGKLRQDTIDSAAKFGLAAEDVGKLKEPVIVRLLSEKGMSPDRLSEMSRKLQKSKTQELSADADAASRSKILLKNPKTLPLLDGLLNDGGSVRETLADPKSARRLLNFLQESEVLTPQEIARYSTPQGGFSEEGKRLVERTLLAAVVPDPLILEDVPSAIVNKLTGNLADLTFAKTRKGWDLSRPLVEALEAYHRFRAEGDGADGKALDTWLNQTDQMNLTPDPIITSEKGRALLEALVKENTAQFKSRIKAYGEDARSLMPGQERMFGTKDTTPDEAFDHAFKNPIEQVHDKLHFLPSPKEAGNRFFQDDLKPTLQNIGKAFKEAGRDILKYLAADKGGPEAKMTANQLREHGAELAQRGDRAEAALKLARDYFARRAVDEGYAFIDRIEAGKKQATPELQAMAECLRSLLDDRLHQVQGLGRLQKFIADYFPHLWRDHVRAAEIFGKRPLEGPKSFLKQRLIPTFEEGRLVHGLEPKYDNPVDMVLAKVREMDKFILGQQTIRELKAKGMVKLIAARDPIPAGFARINDPIATVYGQPNRKGALLIKGYYVAPEPVANVMNNYLSPGLRAKSGLFRAYLGAANVLNQFQLGLSAFHLGFTSMDAATSKLALAIERGARGEFAKAARALVEVPIAPVENLLRGNKVLAEWMRPGSQGAEIASIVDGLKAAGGRVKMDQFYHSRMVQRMTDAWRKGNVVGALWRFPFAAVEAAAKPIMEYIVPRQKLGVFMDLARLEMDKLGPSARRDEVRAAMAKAWDSVDNRMGQLVYDNIFWNHAVKDVGMASVRSLGWNIGTIRELGGGLLDTAIQGRNLLTGLSRAQPRGRKAELTHRMAYAVAMPLLAGLTGGMIHYLMTGKRPEDTKDWFFPRTGEKDPQGREIRLALPSYMKDVVHYADSPGQTVANKLHPALNSLYQMLANRDYYGVKIRNEDDPIMRQVLDEAKFLSQQFEPFAVRETRKLSEAGEPLGKRVLPFVGIVQAPKDLEMTKAEAMARQLAEARMPKGSRTSQEADRATLRYQLANDLRARKSGAGAAIRQAMKDGRINRNDYSIIFDIARTDPLQRSVERLGVHEAMKVWDVASDDEKRKLLPALFSKVQSSESLSPAEARSLLNRLKAERSRLR